MESSSTTQSAEDQGVGEAAENVQDNVRSRDPTSGTEREAVVDDALPHFKLDDITPELSRGSAAALPRDWPDRTQDMVDPLQTEPPSDSKTMSNDNLAPYALTENMLSQPANQDPGFPSECFICPQDARSIQRPIFDTIDEFNVHLWEEHSELSTWTQRKCMWRGCTSPVPFSTAKLWLTHVRLVHQKSFYCILPNCKYSLGGPSPKPFGSQQALDRHLGTKLHAAPVYCAKLGCTSKQNVARKDSRAKHDAEYHGPFLCPIVGCPRGLQVDGIYHGFATATKLAAHQEAKHLTQMHDMGLDYGTPKDIRAKRDTDHHAHEAIQYGTQMQHNSTTSMNFGYMQPATTRTPPRPSITNDSAALTASNNMENIGYLATNKKSPGAVTTKDHSSTQLSGTSSLRDQTIGDCVSGLSISLCNAFPSGFDETHLARVQKTLPSLLKEFAIRLGDDGSSLVYGELKYIVYNYCRQISALIEHNYSKQVDEESAVATNAVALHDKSSLWQTNEDKETKGITDSVFDDEIEDELDYYPEPDPLDLAEYRRVLTQSSAYAWLQSHIQMETDLEIPGSIKTKHEIRHQILQKIGLPARIRRKAQSSLHKIMFDLPWSPTTFYQEQQYKETLTEVLSNAITIIGNGDNVQATTCLQYMDRVWPETGVHLLQLLQSCVGTGTVQSSTMDYNTHVTVYDDPIHIRVSVTGHAFAVAEVGEQLAWLGAALRSSPDDQNIAYCRPFIFESTTSIFYFNFEVQVIQPVIDANSGNCWRNLFRNPIIVTGYPIPRRSVANSGLEISVDVMAILAHARRLVDFCGRTFVKGFSTMIAAMKVVDDTVFWHLFYNGDGDYISYSDPRVSRGQGAQSLSIKNPEAKRHILGWCDNIKNYAGAPDANYDIGWSGLSSPNQSCAFDRVTVSAGKYVNLGVSCAIGIKDKPVQMTFGDDYVGMILMISKRHFVFHDLDKGDRRAWLIDGASALLHLLRASLAHYQSNHHLRQIFCFNDDDLEEARKTHTGADAAFEVLLNFDNQNLSLYSNSPECWREKTTKVGGRPLEEAKEKTTDFCLKDRVEQICSVLEQIMAHQDDVSSQDGVGFRLRKTPRRQLEGFNFMDVATEQGTLWPKVATLRTTGAGWVDFTRKLHAISLFGTGFGDLLKPAIDRGHNHFCLWNDGVPKGKDYLAITVTELKAIITKSGDKSSTPWRVIDNIYWHSPDKTFERCGCLESSRTKHDRVQVLIPTNFLKIWGRGFKSPGELAPGGAVIFGHSWKFPLRWGASIETSPEKGDPITSIEDDDPIFHDSGIGSSQSPLSMGRQGHSPDPFHPSQSANGYLSTDTGLYKLPNQQFMLRDAAERTGVTPELAAMQLPDSMHEPVPSRRTSRTVKKRSISPNDDHLRKDRSVQYHDTPAEQILDDILMSNEPVVKRRKHETRFVELSGQGETRSRKGKEKARF